MVRLHCTREETRTGVKVLFKCSCGFKGAMDAIHEHLTVDHTYPTSVVKIATQYALRKNTKVENDIWEGFWD